MNSEESLRIGLRYVKAEPKSLYCDQSQYEHHQEPEMGFIDIEAHRRFIENLRSLRDNQLQIIY